MEWSEYRLTKDQQSNLRVMSTHCLHCKRELFDGESCRKCYPKKDKGVF